MITVFALTAGLTAVVTPAHSQTVINNVGIVDVESGQVAENQTIVFDEQGIIEISARAAASAQKYEEIIDGSGKFLIPGLIDMHVHADRSALPLFLEYGVTTVRDLGTHFAPLEAEASGQLEMRARVREKTLEGPELFLSLRILDGIERPRWLMHFAKVETPEDGVELVDQIADAGGDFIKVYTDLDPNAFAAIARRAEERGLRLVGHVPGQVGYEAAVRAGLHTAEHLRGIFIDLSSEEERWRNAFIEASEGSDSSSTYSLTSAKLLEMAATYDPEKAANLFTILRENGVGMVPTLVVLDDPRWRYASAQPDPSLVARLSPIYQSIVTPTEDARGPFDSIADGIATHARILQLVREMHQEGVDILVGTDASNPFVLPGVSLHEELAQLVRAGLSNAETLRAATIVNARYLGADNRIGSINVGKEADLVLLRGNPLQDIAATRLIESVFVNGRAVALGSTAEDEEATTNEQQ